MEQIQCVILKPIEIAVVSVCSEKNIVLENLMQTLRVTFKTYLTPSLRNVNIEERNLKVAHNVDQLQEIIISTDINIILILASPLMARKIELTIKKVEDAKYNIGHVFARISAYTKKSFNVLQTYYASRNRTLIFCITGHANEILKCIKETASTMVLGAYLFQRVTEIWEKEKETNNRLQEEDEISHTRQRELPSLLELPSSTIDENVSDEMCQETCQFISVEDALSFIKLTVINDHKIFSPLESEFVEVKDAFGRIVCQAVTSCSDIPPFLVATKKGYAVKVEKKENKMEVETDESSKTSTIILDSDTAVFVDKGKHIPLDTATAVIPIENVRVSNDEAKILINSYSVKYGQNVMFPGSDIKKGDLIINEFTRIFSKEIMLLLTCGCKNVKVFKKLSLGVLTIGNNLLNVGEPLKPKYSYDCNRVLLLSLLEDNNFNCNLLNFGITVEDPICLKTKITEVLEKVDLLVTTGCSNNKNYLKKILKTDFQATFLFENVDMKPGKSTAFAKCYFKNKPKIILCLPKNTASVFMTAHVFLLPLINWIHFNFKENWPIINVEVDKQLLLHRRPKYVWATLSWEEELYPKITCKEENSINNLSYNDDNVLLILPPKTLKKSTLEASSRVPAMLVKPPFSKIQI